MSKSVTVRDLETGKQFTYTLPPREALRACYEQSRGNHNWWDYKDLSCYPIVSSASGLTISLGDLVVVAGGFE